MESPEKDIKDDDETIQIIYNSGGGIVIRLGDYGVALTREEAEQLFVDLGHALQDQDAIAKENSSE